MVSISLMHLTLVPFPVPFKGVIAVTRLGPPCGSKATSRSEKLLQV